MTGAGSTPHGAREPSLGRTDPAAGARPARAARGAPSASSSASRSAPVPRAAAARHPGRRVVDAPTRAFHALFALCFLLAYVTGDSERWRLVHVTMGYTLAGLLGWRIVLGLIGPRRLRLGAAWARTAALRQTLGRVIARTRALAAARSIAEARAAAGAPQAASSAIDPVPVRSWRRDAEAAMRAALPATVLALLAAALPLLATGVVVEEAWTGPWWTDALAELHEGLGEAALALAGAHVAAVLALCLLDGPHRPVSMWTGRAPGAGPDLIRSDLRGWAAVLCAAVLTWWGWSFLGAWLG